MTKHTILFLAANPLGTDRLALDQEARAIHAELERSGHRDRFELVTRWAVQPLDLLRELRRLKPTIVHFSGHGGRAAIGQGGEMGRDVVGATEGGAEPVAGLVVQGLNGRPHLVTTEAIAETFGAAGDSVRLVVLGACYSETQASALVTHVDAVVGMAGAIGDDAARAFAVGFYGGLGEGASVEAAFRQGRAAMSLKGLHDGRMPKLRAKTGVDAKQLVLANAAASLDSRHRRLFRRERFWVGMAFLLICVSVVLTLRTKRTASPTPRRARPKIDCDGVSAGSSMCSYRGTLRWWDGAPAMGIKVELMGAGCTDTTDVLGGFDFWSCDPTRTRRLADPRIFLYLPDKVHCKDIPLQVPPLMTEVRFDPATCDAAVMSRAEASEPEEAQENGRGHRLQSILRRGDEVRWSEETANPVQR